MQTIATITLADLIAYRQRQESLINRVSENNIQTIGGEATAHTFSTRWDPMHHVAIVFGDIRDGKNIPVRLQIESVLDDVFGGSSFKSCEF